MTKLFYVYEHWRPDRDECFYVGKGHGNRANDMRQRNRFHQFIQEKLAYLGMCVEVKLVAEGLSEKDAFRIERERIVLWRADGADLANQSAGGEGCSGYKQTPEAIAKTAAAHRGRKRSPETRARISAKAKLRPANPEAVERMAIANRGRKRVFSDEHRTKIGLASKGRKMSESTRQKLLAANTGRTFQHTAEAKAKMSAALRNRSRMPMPEETRAKIAAALKGKKKTEQHIAAMIAGHKKKSIDREQK